MEKNKAAGPKRKIYEQSEMEGDKEVYQMLSETISFHSQAEEQMNAVQETAEESNNKES